MNDILLLMIDAISTKSDCTKNSVSRLNARLLSRTINFEARTLELQKRDMNCNSASSAESENVFLT